jgi:hypothetical protein
LTGEREIEMIESRIAIAKKRNIAQGGAWVSLAAGLNEKKPRMLAACRLELNDSLK